MVDEIRTKSMLRLWNVGTLKLEENKSSGAVTLSKFDTGKKTVILSKVYWVEECAFLWRSRLSIEAICLDTTAPTEQNGPN